jgi:hypothetical protein
VIVSVAARMPIAEGVNVTPMMRAVFTAYAAAVQPLLKLKSLEFAPLISTEEMCNAAPPEFVMATFCTGLVVPSGIAAKTAEGGVMVAARRGTGAPVPVPVSGTICVEPGASSVIVIEAVRAPSPSGENVTVIVQAALAGYGPLHPLLIAKSLAFAPASITDEICNAAAPELVRVTVCGGLVTPCNVLENDRLAGAIVTPA